MASGISIHRITSGSETDAEKFIQFPFGLYRDNPYWVPWFNTEIRDYINHKHPFFEHSDGDFFIAERSGETAGRICVLEHKRFNEYQHKKHARFYFFECNPDQEAADALFEAAMTWAKARGLEEIYGPMGFSSMTGGGILIDGFDQRAAMTMMPYHLPYYRDLAEKAGFGKYKDFHSAFLDGTDFVLPERIARVAELTLKRGRFTIPSIRTKSELRKYAMDIGRIFNQAWVDHDEHCPLTDAELTHLVNSLMAVADPKMIKVILYDDEIAGFLLAFPDLSAAMQRSKGRLNPLSLIRLRREFKRTDLLVINGIGILQKYQGTGGNALLYYALTETGTAAGVKGGEMPQIAETTRRMLGDMASLGGEIYKTHRVFRRNI